VVDSALRSAFPAIFNTRRSVNVSEDYKLYRSDKIIDIMAENGMKLVEVGQERIGWSRTRQPHTQIHTMRFRDPRFMNRKLVGVGDSVPELLIKNSHDGRCLFSACAALYRLVCLNGLVVPSVALGAVRRRHYGEANDFSKAQEILAEMPKAVAKVSSLIKTWEEMTLTEKQQVKLAKELMNVKSPSGAVRAPEWVKPKMLLEPRRTSDAPARDGTRSLWKTFNVLQEALTNAVIREPSVDGNRARSIRPITGVVDNVGLNARLWTTAEAYADKMGAKIAA
jgi:hypothetical protein